MEATNEKPISDFICLCVVSLYKTQPGHTLLSDSLSLWLWDLAVTLALMC